MKLESQESQGFHLFPFMLMIPSLIDLVNSRFSVLQAETEVQTNHNAHSHILLIEYRFLRETLLRQSSFTRS